MPTSDQSFGLAPLPCKAQLRFEQRYAEPLGQLRRVGFAFQVSPEEAHAPNAHFYPTLARHVENADRPWRWISVSHEKAGLLGQLALFWPGTVRDDSGAGLDQTALLNWTTREMNQASRRILHQNRLTEARNERSSREARRALPWARAGTLLTLLLLVLDASLGSDQLAGSWADRYPDWLTLSATLTLSGLAPMLAYWWWLLRRRLAMDEA